MAGGLGADTMAGGTGDDNYYVDNAGDLASEATGEGVDRVYASVNYALSAGSEVEFLYANAGATGLTLIGNELANTILGVNGADSLVGGGGNDTLNGGLGADTMAGGTGDDTYYVDNAGDIAIEAVGEGIDRVYTTTSYALIAGSEIEFLCTTGAASSLTLTGNGFANNLTGSSGNDTLDGGAGADTLAGGLGADLFSFHIAQAGGDSIADFVPASDKLRFVGYSQGSTFLQVGTSNAWQLTDAMTHATENITFANSAHPGALDYAFV